MSFPSAAALADEELIWAQQNRIVESIRPLLPQDGNVALLDFPDHGNVGDSAIWLGEVACLQSLGLARPCYTCDQSTYSRERLRCRLGQGTILLSGGGNFGDLWEQNQTFRERVILDFPGNPIIQLPQSICFQDGTALKRAQQRLNSHSRLTLLLRNRQSLDFARNEFRAPSLLCPDMAFCLGPLHRPAAVTDRIVLLARMDKESATPTWPASPGIERLDWLDETQMKSLNGYLWYWIKNRPRVKRLIPWLVSWMQNRIAHARLNRGCRLLARGSAVISDRLHVHILCLLLGVKHFVLDNSYGKVRSYYETWTSASRVAHWCESAEEAAALALSASVPGPCGLNRR